jgi:hypothetical protein
MPFYPRLLLVLAGVAPVHASDPFTIVLLPDTQHYTDSAVNFVQFEAQTQWIIDNLALENLVFVTQAGDLVEHGAEGPGMNQVEWDRADLAMGKLDGDLLQQPDGLVPYATVPGNHDYDVVGARTSATQYIATFGPSRYVGRSWFVGAAPNQINMAQTFEVDGRGYLHLGLEWHPSDAAIEWAQSQLEAHPDRLALITTHVHLGTGIPARRSTTGATPDSGGTNAGDGLYRKLVEPYPQVFLVLSGHYYGDGRVQSTTVLGGNVLEILADYQADPNGGNGWMQLLEFRPATAELELRTVSPTYVAGTTAGPDRSLSRASNVTLALDLDQLHAGLTARRTLRFRRGQDNGYGVYAGTVDTNVGNGSIGTTRPEVSYGNELDVRVDGDGDAEQGLLRFDDFIGNDPGQLPEGTEIEAAVLTLTTEGSDASSQDGARLHRMTTHWEDESTWGSLVNGVQIGFEALSAFDVDTTGFTDRRGTRSFDVTASVQAWLNGEENHGWVIVGNGPDGWTFRSSEWTTLVERPMLTIVFPEPCSVTTYCTASPSSAGTPGRLRIAGTTSLSTNALTYEAYDLPSSTIGIFFDGATALDPGAPFGNGLLCVGGRVQRLSVSVAQAGAVSQPQDLAGPFYKDVEPGDTRHVQFWFRDPPAGGARFNLTEGMSVVFCP